MRITGGVLAFLFLLTAQSMPVAQIGNPMPPPGAVGDPAPDGPGQKYRSATKARQGPLPSAQGSLLAEAIITVSLMATQSERAAAVRKRKIAV